MAEMPISTLTPEGGKILMEQLTELVLNWGWSDVMEGLAVIAESNANHAKDEPTRQAWFDAVSALTDLA